LALLGVSFKTLFINRFETLSVLTYILMGWLSLAMMKDLAASLSLNGVIWLAVGGALYTVGVVFYALHRIPYTHAIWHIFVLGGSICHYFAILLYLAPFG
jgi:hemolysin III